MRILVTGSSGHLGEALVRTLRARGDVAVGLDLKASRFTDVVGSITDHRIVQQAMAGVEAVLHTATLHKPHMATHSRQAFIDTNVSGTLTLLEEATSAGVGAFVYTSTTSLYGDALTPATDAPAAWITEDVVPVPKNIYGVTKAAAEGLCELFARRLGLPVVVLRTSRFFPEDDDSKAARAAHASDNIKANEFLYRRVALEDVVGAHLAAQETAARRGFGKYIVSATTPFTEMDLPMLRTDPAAVVRRYVPEFEAEYARRGWSLPADIERVYVNAAARRDLGWVPLYDFARIIAELTTGGSVTGPLAREVGSKGYHEKTFAEGPYPVEHS
jgi:UDP-glucose 4-epimerase